MILRVFPAFTLQVFQFLLPDYVSRAYSLLVSFLWVMVGLTLFLLDQEGVHIPINFILQDQPHFKHLDRQLLTLLFTFIPFHESIQVTLILLIFMQYSIRGQAQLSQFREIRLVNLQSPQHLPFLLPLALNVPNGC